MLSRNRREAAHSPAAPPRPFAHLYAAAAAHLHQCIWPTAKCLALGWAQERRKAGKEFVPGRRVEVLVELLVYAAVVFVLGAAAVSDFSKMDEDAGQPASSSSHPGAAYYLAEITWSQD